VPNARTRSAVLVLFSSAILVGFGMIANHYFDLAATISVYLFITLAIADKAGFVEASIVSVVAFLCLEYYFASPFWSFRVYRVEDWIALIAFEGVSLIVSRLSYRARLHQRALEKQNIEQQALYELCRDILLLDWKQSPQRQLCMLVKRSFPLRGVALWNSYEDALSFIGEAPNAEETVKAIYFNERNYDDPTNSASFRVLYFGTRAIGALMLYGHSVDIVCVNSIASIVAMGIERTRSLTLEMNVEAERHSEELRSALLDGLAHAFKTPLSTITLASSGLLAQQRFDARQARLLELINREAARLSQLTTRLLKTSHLELSRFVLREHVVDVQDLLQGTLDDCALLSAQKHVNVCIASDVTSMRCDPQLISLALVQIIDNATKYGSQEASVDISAQKGESAIVFRIHNEGSYIPFLERSKVFTRFYRSPSVEHRAVGTGLGLAIAKKAVAAHDGRILIESDIQLGTTFVVSIPASTEGNK